MVNISIRKSNADNKNCKIDDDDDVDDGDDFDHDDHDSIPINVKKAKRW
jgi:hypothetical protein